MRPGGPWHAVASQLLKLTWEAAEAEVQVETGPGGHVAGALSSCSISGDYKY